MVPSEVRIEGCDDSSQMDNLKIWGKYKFLRIFCEFIVMPKKLITHSIKYVIKLIDFFYYYYLFHSEGLN